MGLNTLIVIMETSVLTHALNKPEDFIREIEKHYIDDMPCLKHQTDPIQSNDKVAIAMVIVHHWMNFIQNYSPIGSFVPKM